MEGVEHGELAERFAYVFGGTVDPDTWSAADEDERALLVEKRFGSESEAQRAVRTIVVTQLLAGDPPATWATARRLDGLGLGTEAVLNQLSVVLAQTLRDVIGQLEDTSKGRPDEVAGDDGVRGAAAQLAATLTARFERLPLPPLDEVEDALVEAAAGAGVIDAGELVEQARGRFDGWEDDSMLAQLVEHALDGLIEDEEGPLVTLPGDDVGHVDRLRDGIVLTHVLSDSERTIGALAVSFDLAGFGRVPEPTFDGEPLEPVSAEAGHVAWMGDKGWLERFDAGTTLAVRVSSDGDVRIDPLPASPVIDPELVAALLDAYHRVADDSELPVSGEELVFALLAADRDVFREPRAPLDTLCEAAGLERRASAAAHDPAFWANESWFQRADRIHAAAHGDHELAHDVLRVLDLADVGEDAGEDADERERDRVRVALDALDHIEVISLVADELFDEDTWPERAEHATAVVDRLLGLARRPGERAAAHYLAAGAAERERDLAAAERHLQLAVDADPDHVLALDRLAWWASDRGDAARAVRLWRRCPPVPTVSVDLATVEPFAAGSAPELGRNERCWCGSGRKYKQCHLGVTSRPALADRVGWLHRKAAGYLGRSGPAARDAVVDLVARLVGDEDEDLVVRTLQDPLTTDLLLTEGGWFRRFLADRGELLPDDEALLAAAWATVDRTVYEVVDVSGGVGLTLRDLRAGDTVDVRERTFSTTATTGMLICARAVPDGDTHQLVGAVRPVPPGREVELIDLLDQGQPDEIAAWFAAFERPPVLRTREGEPLVECEIVVTTGDTAALVAHLDASYDIADAADHAGETSTSGSGSGSGSGSWIEHHDLDDEEAVLRAAFRLDGDRLTITTNSEPRADRILRRLRDAVGDVTVLDDVRSPVDPTNLGAARRGGLPDLSGLPEPPEVLDEEAVAGIQDHLERRWCDDRIPALGGLTPRQAAADPTRREQLERLLASFDTHEPPVGGIMMRTERLRTLLGL